MSSPLYAIAIDIPFMRGSQVGKAFLATITITCSALPDTKDGKEVLRSAVKVSCREMNSKFFAVTPFFLIRAAGWRSMA